MSHNHKRLDHKFSKSIVKGLSLYFWAHAIYGSPSNRGCCTITTHLRRSVFVFVLPSATFNAWFSSALVFEYFHLMASLIGAYYDSSSSRLVRRFPQLKLASIIPQFWPCDPSVCGRTECSGRTSLFDFTSFRPPSIFRHNWWITAPFLVEESLCPVLMQWRQRTYFEASIRNLSVIRAYLTFSFFLFFNSRLKTLIWEDLIFISSLRDLLIANTLLLTAISFMIYTFCVEESTKRICSKRLDFILFAVHNHEKWNEQRNLI